MIYEAVFTMKRRLFLILILILFVSNILVNQSELSLGSETGSGEVTFNPAQIRWTQTNGPPGGHVTRLIQNPHRHDELYAMIDGHIYKSEDKGENWRLIREFEQIDAHSIAVFYNDLFVSGENLYRLSGEGNVTEILSHWCEEVIISDDRLFVTSGHDKPEGVKIFRADLSSKYYDWKDISPSESELSDLALPPEHFGFWHEVHVPNIITLGDRILANIMVSVEGSGVLANGHLYRSEDLGGTWSRVDLDVQDDLIITDIVQDPNDSEHILLTFKHNTDAPTPLSELLRESHDGGKTWSRLTDLTLKSKGITDLDVFGSTYYLISPFDSLRIIKLEGSQFELLEVPMFSEWGDLRFGLEKLLFDLDDPNTVYGQAWAFGIVKSEDGMETWRKIDGDIIASSPSIILIHPDDQDIIYATGNNIQESYFTRDGGESWEPFSPNAGDDEVKIDPHDTDHILLIDELTWIHESWDQGETFKIINRNFTSAKVIDLEIAPDDPEKIYVSNLGVGISVYEPTEGDPWRYLTGSPDYAYDIEFDPENSGIIYATYSPKIFENHSSIWRYSEFQEENSGWTELYRFENSAGITSLRFDPSNPKRIYAGVTGEEGTIYVSKDKGETWEKLNEELTFTTIWGHSQLQIDPRDSNVVYAGTWGGGTYKTINGGKD